MLSAYDPVRWRRMFVAPIWIGIHIGCRPIVALDALALPLTVITLFFIGESAHCRLSPNSRVRSADRFCQAPGSS